MSMKGPRISFKPMAAINAFIRLVLSVSVSLLESIRASWDAGFAIGRKRLTP
jgi:hypothetical protein